MRKFGLKWVNFTVTCTRKLDEKINKANKVYTQEKRTHEFTNSYKNKKILK